MKFLSFLGILGTVAFAISGALLAIKKDMDYFGIVFSAITTSVGGGIIRDILINKDLPAALSDPIYIIISIISALITIFFYNKVLCMNKLLLITDAIGLGAFTAIGSQIAITSGITHPIVIIILAILTGTGGGVIRDVLAKEIPFIFQKEVYAVASMLGSLLFIILNKYIGNEAALYGCFTLTVVIRIYCMKKNIHLKKVSKENQGKEVHIKHIS